MVPTNILAAVYFVLERVQGAFLFSCVWSLGALLDVADRYHFDVIFRALLAASIPHDVRGKYDLPDELCTPAGGTIVSSIPRVATVFDYSYIPRVSRLPLAAQLLAFGPITNSLVVGPAGLGLRTVPRYLHT